MMRVMLTSALAFLALASLSASVQAAPCPTGMVQVCDPQPRDRPPMGPPRCHCENTPGSPTWGGKAEIHKKNVPTVKPNKSPGPND
ncbi:hypothetical protein TSA1_15415 [Bradyrhizobium nitroreducens]|uniref:Uncharacterized protein n=1 Tax=Bradyrhizobium nitroreducens TaxID=709803 RepID=A0A2M6UBS0_9BRAD|nr:hypothetical protein [Bradyrhizobium nitroreducens]PIT01997.1 hypothetical protein TSA1_15415 [Bradyrhizobium nitroreducens]